MEFEKARDFFKERNFVIKDNKLKAIMTAIDCGYPVFITGPTSTGKSLFLTLLAEFYGGVYDYQSLNGSITIHDLTQERVLGKNGQFEERDMVLAKWLRNSVKQISILHLDEINAAKPETLLALHPIMDIKGELNLPYTDEVLKVTKNAIIVMSANEGDEYTGINGLNMAFQNRLVKVHFSYLSNGELTNMLVKKTGVEKTKVEQVVNCWEKYMSSKDIDKPVVGIRILERWLEMSKTIGLKTAGEFTFGTLICENEEELISITEGDFFISLTD